MPSVRPRGRGPGSNCQDFAPLTPLLTFHQLGFAHASLSVFSGLSGQIAPGVTLISGDEGAGKTTLLRVLAGEWAPSAGSLIWRVPQPSVFWADPRSSAWDSLTLDACLAVLSAGHPAWDCALAADLQHALELAPHAGKEMFRLSTGSRRKVLLTAAFASGATLTLLDMPFAALDAPSRGVVRELLAEAAQHAHRAWVVADYEAPAGVPLSGRLSLPV